MQINVTKRDGSLQKFDLDKVHKVLEWATEGITGVSQSEIELKSNIQLYDKIPHYEIIKDSIKTDKLLNEPFLSMLKQKLNPIEINEMDGIKLIWANKWIHIRKSNTEPIIRFYSEAEEIKDSTELIKQAKKIFNN